MKIAARRTVVIISIILLSVLIGFAYYLIGGAVDRGAHPRPEQYSAYIERYSSEYGVPEYIVYAVILEKSGFVSNLVSEDGRVGLMQISPDTFRWLLTLTKETLEPGMLYEPETNIRYGTYMMSYLYTKYNRWETVYVAMEAGVNATEVWKDDPAYADANGNFIKIPDADVEREVKKIEKSADMYMKLYYSENQ